LIAGRDERQSAWVCFHRFLASEKGSMIRDDGKNEMLEDAVECGGQTISEMRKYYF